MNENIDLTKILKDCPKGTKFYSPILGDVIFERIDDKSEIYPIITQYNRGISNEPMFNARFTKEGLFYNIKDTKCILFPSEDQRDWSKFSAPWYKKERFDPKTLKPFDRILGRDCDTHIWRCNLFSHITEQDSFPYKCVVTAYRYCIPYNTDTKHLVGTKEEAPEYYRYWED